VEIQRFKAAVVKRLQGVKKAGSLARDPAFFTASSLPI
jgi:hypothetical protein